MPRVTERQQAADALHRAFLINLMVETELDQARSDSSSSSSSDAGSSSSSSSSSSEDEPMASTSDMYVNMAGNLYSQHYYNTRGNIPKTLSNLQLLLDNHKHNRPEIFRSYLRVTPECFDALVAHIKEDPVFLNNSQSTLALVLPFRVITTSLLPGSHLLDLETTSHTGFGGLLELFLESLLP